MEYVTPWFSMTRQFIIVASIVTLHPLITRPVYSLLPEDEGVAPEEKSLLEQDSSAMTVYQSATIPRKMIVTTYIFLAFSVVLAVTNASLYACQMRAGKHQETSLSDLPHPDIFAGLPKLPGHSGHGMLSHNHSHSHTHKECKQNIDIATLVVTQVVEPAE